jgi:hypothetical protein
LAPGIPDGIPVVAVSDWSEPDWREPENLQKGGTIYAGPFLVAQERLD